MLAIYLSSTIIRKVPVGTAPHLALGEGNAETARSREAFCRGLHTQGIYGSARKGEAAGTEGKGPDKRKEAEGRDCRGYLTIGQPQRFEGGRGSDRVGGVDEVERGAEDP